MRTIKENREENEVSLKVPSDILIDVLAIVIKEEVPYHITQIIEMRKVAVLVLQIDKMIVKHVKALQNIQQLISLYNDYRFNDEQTDWRQG